MYDLFPHQVEALTKMKNGCILRGGVGSGKTITSLVYYFENVCGGVAQRNGAVYKRPDHIRHLYVITTAKKRDELDWERDAVQLGITSYPEEGLSGLIITVDSWNNIAKYIGVKDAFFIFDEQRLVGSGAWVKSFYKIAKQNLWILLSATPGDTWLDYIPVFVANGFYRNKTDFIDTHVVWDTWSKFPKVKGYVRTGRLVKQRNDITVVMPYKRHTTRKVIDVKCLYSESDYDVVTKRLWHAEEDRPIKDVSERYRLMRKVANSNESRLAHIRALLEKHPRLIVFYNFNYELDALRRLADALGITFAEWNGHRHQPIPEDGRWLYLVQYVAGAEGWNCITTDAMVLYSLNYSYKINEQVMGRIDRLNTPFDELYYYRLVSDASIDKMILQAIKEKRDFNEREAEKTN